jgi:DNA-binding CsgD family transcriptional regulator/GAF domain-containing protein
LSAQFDTGTWERTARYAQGLLSRSEIESVQAQHLRSVGGLIGADAYGITALEPATLSPSAVATDGLSDAFLESYEEAGGRRGDVFFQYILAKRRAVHDRILFPAGDWTDQMPEIGQLLREDGLSHALLAPLVHQGALVGTLHFSRSASRGPFTDHDIRTASLIAGFAAPALAFAQERSQMREEFAATRALVRDIPRSVVLCDFNGRRICESERAARLYGIPGSDTQRQLELVLRRNVHEAAMSGAPVQAQWETVEIETTRVTGTRTIFVSYLYESASPRVDASALVPPLTPREAEVLESVALGMRDREVGEALGISTNTVKRHLKNIYSKLGARGRTDAVRQAIVAQELDSGGG